MPRFKTVFFDSGGTLYGSGDGSAPSAEEVAAERVARVAAMLKGLGRDIPVAELQTAVEACEPRVSEEKGLAFTFFELARELVDYLGLPIGDEEAALLADAYAGPRYSAWLFPGTMEVMEILFDAGVYLGVIANTAWPGFSMDRAFAGVGLLPYFSTRVYSGDIGLAKPDPRIFEHALQVSGRSAEDILYVGNDLEKDVRGASGVGWATAFRATDDAGSGGLADFDFKETHELLDFIDISAEGNSHE